MRWMHMKYLTTAHGMMLVETHVNIGRPLQGDAAQLHIWAAVTLQ